MIHLNRLAENNTNWKTNMPLIKKTLRENNLRKLGLFALKFYDLNFDFNKIEMPAWYQITGFAQDYKQIRPLLTRFSIPTPELPLDHQNLHRPWHLIKDSIKKIEKINHRQLLHQHANLPYLL